MLFSKPTKSLELPSKENALAGGTEPAEFNPQHFVSGHRIVEPVPDGLQSAIFGLGCFWGAERLFWELPGVYSTAVGYSGGVSEYPTYEGVCSGRTGHSEVVKVFYDPNEISFEQLLAVFWDSHDPTQGMRQGNDRGTQYRSAIYTTSQQQLIEAQASAVRFQTQLSLKNYPEITTEIKGLESFYYADDNHQQYLAKNPAGYCGLAGTGACYQPEPA